MTPQTPAALRERADEIERLRSDVARLTAERNALRATVDRLRPVVEALAEGCDRCAEHATRGDVFCATRQRDILTDALGPASPGTWRDKAAALRALLATPDAVADGPLDTSMATDPERDSLRATVDRLRPVVEALAAWLDVEAGRNGDEESAYDAWSRATDAVTLALGLPAKRWDDAVPTLRALLAAPDAVADERPRPALPEVPDGD